MAVVKNKTFTLSETENEKQLLFYRNDGQILDGNAVDFEEEILKLYESYIACKMVVSEEPTTFNLEFDFEMSDDKKYITLSFFERNYANPNIFMRFIDKFFA